MKEAIGVGVIGCGAVGWIGHLPWYWENPKAEVKAVCDVDPAKAQWAAQRWGAERWHTQFEELLEREDIAAVSIATPPQFHCEQVLRAAAAGKHILCEKPMAPTLEECDRMIEAAERNKVKLMVGFMKRFNPAFQRIKEIIDGGLIGKVFHLDVHWESASPAARAIGWRAMEKSVGGGIFQDHGSHYIDLFRWWTGSEVELVSGETMQVAPERVNEDHAVALLRLGSGAVGVIETSSQAYSISPLRHFEGPNLIEYGYIYGTEGGILFDALPWDAKELPKVEAYFRKGKLCQLEGWHRIQLPPTVRQPGGALSPGENTSYWFKREIDHFINCIIEDTEPLVTGRDGRAAIEVILAVYKSQEMEEKVRLGGKGERDV